MTLGLHTWKTQQHFSHNLLISVCLSQVLEVDYFSKAHIHVIDGFSEQHLEKLILMDIETDFGFSNFTNSFMGSPQCVQNFFGYVTCKHTIKFIKIQAIKENIQCSIIFGHFFSFFITKKFDLSFRTTLSPSFTIGTKSPLEIITHKS